MARPQPVHPARRDVPPLLKEGVSLSFRPSVYCHGWTDCIESEEGHPRGGGRLLFDLTLQNRITRAAFLLLNLKTAIGGEFFLTQRRREAENAEKIANL